jgi:RNA polymerase sigma factor (sigma-70 family)
MAAPLHFLNQDVRLLDRMRHGDEDALVTVYQQSRKAVIALVTRNSGTAMDADDILQEAVVVLWERVRAGTYEHSAKLETFVYAVAQNLWRRRLARNRKEVRADPAAEGSMSDDPSPLESIIETEEAGLVASALRRLGEPCRALLLLFYWEELSMEEIATRLGFANAETAKSKKYQCKKMLQTMLKELAPNHG